MKALACFLLLPLAGCEQEPFPEYIDFFFQIPFTLTPVRDTVAVGDTLWLAADFSDQLQEFTSGQRYPVTPANFELRTNVGFYKLADPTKSISQQSGATTAFTLVNQTGSVNIVGATFGNLTYVYTPGRYRLRVGIIARERGVFSIDLGDRWGREKQEKDRPDLSYIDLGLNQEGVPRRAVFRTVFYGINDGQTNFGLFQQHCRAISLTVPTESNINYEQKATYTFVVK